MSLGVVLRATNRGSHTHNLLNNLPRNDVGFQVARLHTEGVHESVTQEVSRIMIMHRGLIGIWLADVRARHTWTVAIPTFKVELILEKTLGKICDCSRLMFLAQSAIDGRKTSFAAVVTLSFESNSVLQSNSWVLYEETQVQVAQLADSVIKMHCGSSLFTGHVPTHPFPEASPDPNLTLTQTLDLTQGRVGTWPATEQGPALPSEVRSTPTWAPPTHNPLSCSDERSKREPSFLLLAFHFSDQLLLDQPVFYHTGRHSPPIQNPPVIHII